MTQRIILASTNRGKLQELQRLFADSDAFEFVLAPEPLEVAETGASFAQNARLKAIESARYFGAPCLADDSGLVIDALGGRPGIYSARYADTDEARIARVLAEMQEIPPDRRQAAFVCAMCLAYPDQCVIEVEGRCEGAIADAPTGEGGFGYDPIFWVPTFGCTFAELTPDDKDRISHRAIAALQLKQILAQLSPGHGWQRTAIDAISQVENHQIRV